MEDGPLPPRGVRSPQILLLGILGGIGFTMSVFIANLAFDDPALLAAAKLGVLVGSAVAATLGFVVGRVQSPLSVDHSRG